MPTDTNTVDPKEAPTVWSDGHRAEKARRALEEDANPTPTTPGWSGVYNFHFPFPVVSAQGVNVQCLRTVVVNYNPVPSHGNRVQKVTNSFTGRVLP